MKIIRAFFLIAASAFALFAQTSDPVLATANGQNFTVQDLPPQIAENYRNLPKTVAATRAALLEQQIAETLFETEARAKATTAEKLIAEIKAKVPTPPDKDIQAVYDASRASIGSKSLAEVRPQIVVFLKSEPEQKALDDYLAQLKTKYKPALGKDVNAVNLKPTDALATVGGKTISLQDFEAKNRIALYEIKARVFDEIKYALNQMIFTALLSEEAKAQNLASSDLMAREITDKLRDFSDNEEREKLETELKRKLFAKYKTEILLKEPAPLVLNVTTGENPAKGGATARVTVVMFSDFQCSHCAATHPVLEKVLAEYGAAVRFVVRDYPLTAIHENAFQAAVAANAAHAQGKFFEYIEILYRNQDALSKEFLVKYAGELGLNLRQFELDLQSEKNAAEVRRDLADGKSYGITGTPTIFVNGVKVRQNSAEGFRNAIDKALKQ